MHVSNPTGRQSVPAWTLAACVLPVVSLIFYWPSLHTGFVFDDARVILEGTRPFDGEHIGRYLDATGRGFALLTFDINAAIHGHEPGGYKLFNLLVHLTAGLVLFAFVRALSRRWRIATWIHPTAVAFAASLLWLVHPLTTQAVAYTVQRGESLMALCYLLTLWAAWRSGERHARRRWVWASVAVAACMVGMFCKQVMVTAPLAVVLLDHQRFDLLSKAVWRRRGLLYAALWSTCVVFVIAGGAAAVTGADSAGINMKQVSPAVYAMTQPAVVLRYMWLGIWPQALNIDHLVEPVASWREAWPAWVLLAPFVLLAFVGCIGVAGRRHLKRFTGQSTQHLLRACSPIAWCAAMMLLILAPTSSIVPIQDLMVEHRFYLPLAFMVTGLVWFAVWVTAAAIVGATVADRRRRLSVGLIVVALSLALPLGIRTSHRLVDYADERTIWMATLRVDSDNPRAHFNLGALAAKGGQWQEALQHYQHASEASIRIPGLATRVGSTLAAMDRHDEAARAFERAILFNPSDPSLRMLAARSLLQINQGPAAKHHLDVAARSGGDLMQVTLLEARIHQAMGESQLAQQSLEKALEQWPDAPSPVLHLAMLHRQQGDYSAAAGCYRRLLSQDELNVAVMVVLVRFFAACPEQGVRNPQLARALLTRIAASASPTDYGLRQLEAMTLACEKKFGHAIAIARQAKAAAELAGDDQTKLLLEQQIAHYARGQVWLDRP